MSISLQTACGSCPPCTACPIDTSETIDSTMLTSPIDDFTTHATNIATYKICRKFARDIATATITITEGKVDDIGYVGAILVTTTPPPCGGAGTVVTPVNVTSACTIIGSTIVIPLIAVDDCCCAVGWGNFAAPLPAKFHWQVTLVP